MSSSLRGDAPAEPGGWAELVDVLIAVGYTVRTRDSGGPGRLERSLSVQTTRGRVVVTTSGEAGCWLVTLDGDKASALRCATVGRVVEQVCSIGTPDVRAVIS